MPSLSRAVATTTLLSATAAAVVMAGAHAASAATTCVAHASMPARVALAAHPVTVRMVLRGTSGCDTGGVDGGATATLVGPGAKDPHRWARFGRTDTQTFQARVDAPGTYTLRDGDVQVYDRGDERVAARWRPTSIEVRRASRVRGLDRHGTTLSGRVQTYGATGWQGHRGADVVLERDVASKATTWRPVVREQAVRGGRFVFTGLHHGVGYRVVSTDTRTAWGATSHRV